MKLLDGKKLAGEILKEVKKEAESHRPRLGLAAILVGDNSVSKIYIRQKEKACQGVGISFRLFKFEKSDFIGRLFSECTVD